ncbi:MAG: response regulator [Bacteroidetes bacterium]|nr:response regulator [Bacteroidota bacterium]MBS1931196.1 response regulator [Bacteroidota bacterium]
MAKILVVDDEADLEILIKQKFRQKIRERQYEFLFAVNGVRALEQIEEHHDIDVVLSDINMPEMDGLTLLSKLNEQNSLLKAVIVSAYGDMENIRTAMNRGAFDFITKPVNFDDLEVTIEKTLKHVHQLRETMKAIKENNILKMYVDETVLNFMGSREFESSLMQNETVDATVMFLDICHFTSISESEKPDTVVKLLNSYFDVMVKEIITQGGFIDKFIGDAIMAVFRGDYHLDRAVDASLAVRKKIDELPYETRISLERSAVFKPKVSIGINSGEMISGNIGSANLRRLDYTVIGDTVNTAQRLQSVAKEGQIIITESCYEKIKESFNCRKVGEATLKNKLQPVVIYEVLD